MKKMRTLFILDPGHGVDVPGKRSPEIPPGFEEWKFVREIADLIYRAADGNLISVSNLLSGQKNKDLKISIAKEIADIANHKGWQHVIDHFAHRVFTLSQDITINDGPNPEMLVELRRRKTQVDCYKEIIAYIENLSQYKEHENGE